MQSRVEAYGAALLSAALLLGIGIGPQYYQDANAAWHNIDPTLRLEMKGILDPTVDIWPPAGDALIWSINPDTNWGSTPELWVGDTDRSLIVWDLSPLPERAMVDYSEAILELVANDGPAMDVSAHRLTSSWTESGVTWNSRDGTDDWGTPGGDFDASAEDVVRVGVVTDTLHSWVLTDLVAEWHSGNRANYGILLQPESYPASATKVFGSKEGSGWSPRLDVSYRMGPVGLTPYVPFAWGVPSPDWYSVSGDSHWSAVAIRPPTDSDYDLGLSSTDEYTDTLAQSAYPGDAVDYVLMDGHHAPSGTYYPSVRQYSGRGPYRIEQATHTAELSVGTLGPYTMTDRKSVV